MQLASSQAVALACASWLHCDCVLMQVSETWNPLPSRAHGSRKTEHFRRWQQFMRYAVVHGHSYVHLCATRDQFADGLTKVTNATQYLDMRATMLNL